MKIKNLIVILLLTICLAATAFTLVACDDMDTPIEDVTTTVTWAWSEDCLNATATVTLSGGKTGSITVDATVRSEYEVTPDCENGGRVKYTATVEYEGATASDTKTVTVGALGHDYQYAEMVWEGYDAQAKFLCTRDKKHVKYYPATVTSEISEKPSCTKEGKKVYTAVYDGKSAVKEEVLPATAHTEGEAVKEKVVPATCETSGSYDLAVYCTVCSTELSRKTVTVDPIGHDYEPTWAWDAFAAATVTFTCKKDPTHIHTAEAVISSETTKLSCTQEGKTTYTATATFDGKVYTDQKIETLLATAHTAGDAVKENETPATCQRAGSYDSVVYCSVCGEELSRTSCTTELAPHAESDAVVENDVPATCINTGSYDLVVYCTVCKKELSRVHVTTEVTDHTAGEPVTENETSATCETGGSYDSVVYCSVCGNELSRETVSVNPLGHTYEIEWSWKETASATATFTCTRDGSHTHTEVAMITSETCDPTCTADGETVYTATVTFEDKTYADQKSVTLYAFGHTEGTPVIENKMDPTCLSDGGYDSVVYCTVCGDELSRRFVSLDKLEHTPATAVKENITPATCEVGGKYDSVVYCSKCNTELSRETVTTDPLGHDYAVAWSWNGTESATATLTCKNDPTHTHTAEAVITSETTEQSCTTVGGTTFTATVTFDGVTYTDQKSEALPALGHDYVFSCFVWNGHDSAYALFTCSRNHEHYLNCNAIITHEGVEATCENAGSVTYTATAVYNDKTYTDTKTETLKATGHDYAVTWEWEGYVATLRYVCRNDDSHAGTIAANMTERVLTEATCTATGSVTHIASATLDDVTYTDQKTEEVSATGHTFEETWSYDENYHWHNATCGHDLQSEKGEHSFEDGACTVCGYLQIVYSKGLSMAASGSGASTTYTVNGIGSCTDTELYIPATYNGYPVTAIEANAFKGNTSITYVYLPDSIVQIGSGAFAGCTKIAEMSLPFAGDKSHAADDYYQYPLGYIFGDINYSGTAQAKQTYRTSASTTATRTYYIPSSLKTVTVRKGVIVYGAFNNCANITTVNILPAVTRIGNRAFSGMSTSVTVNFTGTVSDWANVQLEEYNEATPLYTTNNFYVNGVKATEIENVVVNAPGKTISRYHFYKWAAVKTLVVNDVAEIKGSAFASMVNLQSMTLPFVGEKRYETSDTTQYTLGYVFGTSNVTGTTSARQYYTKNGSTSSYSTYYLPTSLTTVVITDGLIPYGAFMSCTMLVNITIPEDTTVISSQAFSGCTALKNVNLPDSITTINYQAFYNCTSLTEIVLGASLKTLGSNLFYNCKSVTSIVVNTPALPDFSSSSSPFNGMSPNSPAVVLGADVERIPNYMFYGVAIRSIDVSAATKLSYIGAGAFYNCTYLTAIVIPETVTTIGNYAFYNCNRLTRIEYRSDNMKDASFSNLFYQAGTNAVSGVTVEVIFGANVTVIPSYLLSSASGVTKITFEEGSRLTTIATYAFSGLNKLAEISLPATLTTVQSNAFNNCSALKKVDFEGSIKDWLAIDFAGSTATPLAGGAALCVDGEEVEELSIPADATKIGAYALYNFTSLVNVVIPDSVESIGNYAFYGCVNMETLTLGTGVKSIANSAFGKCEKLLSVVLPSSLEEIGSYAFEGCIRLAEVGNKSSLEVQNGSTENGYVAYYAVHVYDANSEQGTLAVVGNYTFVSGEEENYLIKYSGSDPDLTLPSSYKGAGYAIYGYAFQGAEIQSVVIPGGVTAIGKRAFDNCASLQTASIANSVGYIGDYAFYACPNLEVTALSNALTYVGHYAFKDVKKLCEITLSGGLETIGDRAFAAKEALANETLVVPDTVTYIGNGAFAGFNALTEITIPFIGNKAYEEGEARQYPFGYIFGDSYNAGAQSVSQKYYASSSNPTYSTTYYIPTALEKVTVTGGRIINGAFSGCNNLKTVVIPDDVTKINAYAFSDCTALESVNIPGGVTVIDERAFSNCKKLKDVSIPSALTTIGTYAFYYTAIESLSLPETVTTFGTYAFYYCTSLKSVSGAGVTNVSGSAFQYCSALETVNFPALTALNSSAFANCTSLTAFEMPTGVISLGSYAFSYCTALKTLKLNEGLTTIGSFAFNNCTLLEEINIPSTITTMQSDAFNNCKALLTVKFGGTIADWTGIYFSAATANPLSSGATLYIGGTKLESLTIPEGVTEIKSYAFAGANLSDVTFASTVTTIGSNAFVGCKSVKVLTIPASVTSIGSGAFNGWAGLEELTIPFVGDSLKTSSSTYKYPLGYIFGTTTYEGGVATSQQYRTSGTSTTSATYYLPASLEKVTVTGGNILYGAFYNCKTVKEIVLPEELTAIEPYAFYGCGITSFTLPDDVIAIDTYTFYNCTNLASVTTHEYLTTIGNYAFYGCSALTSITLHDGLTSLGNNAFYGCSSLKSIVLPDSITSLGSSVLCNCTALTSVNIPTGISAIGNYAFQNCSALMSVVIPSNVTSIGTSAFQGCDKLLEVYNLSSLTLTPRASTNGYVAYNAKNIYTSLEAPSTVTTTADGFMFFTEGDENYYLVGYVGTDTEITLPASYKDEPYTIYQSAFSGCTQLTKVVVPDGVKEIGQKAFAGCSGLVELTLPFVGDKVHATNDNNQYPLGYIFGTTFYAGSTSASQTYKATSSTTTASYYIPDSLKKVTVTDTRIPRGAFYNCKSLTSIQAPNATDIGYGAFYNCTAVTDFDLSAAKILGDYALNTCSALTEISLPEVTSMGQNAFTNCSALTEITMPKVATIGNNAFASCTSLKKIDLPTTLTSVGTTILANCTALEEMTVPFLGASTSPSGSTALFNYYFGTSSATGLTSVQSYYSESGSKTAYVPSTLKKVVVLGGSVCFGAFQNAAMLTEVVLPASLTKVNKLTFSGCRALTTVTLPDTLTTIGDYAFANCKALASIQMSASLTTIGEGAFQNATSLMSITLPEGLSSIGNDAFDGCTTLLEVVNLSALNVVVGQTTYGKVAYYAAAVYDEPTESKLDVTEEGFVFATGDDGSAVLAAYRGEETEVILPESYKGVSYSIRPNAFSGSGVTSITIGNGVSSVGEKAFYNCASLTDLYYNASSAVEFTTSGYTFTSSRPITLHVGKAVTILPSHAFADSSIGSVIFAEDGALKTIDDYAFYYTSRLTALELPASLETIGESAFQYCTSLSSVTFPSGLKTIAAGAFYGDSSLSSVVMDKGVVAIGAYAFPRVTNFTFNGTLEDWVTIDFSTESANPAYNSNVVIGGKAVTEYVDLTFADDLERIGDYALVGFANVKSVTVPQSVTYLGVGFLYGCNVLESLTLPYVGRNADPSKNENSKIAFASYFPTQSFTDSGYVNYSGTQYYIPTSLTEVTVLGGALPDEAFRDMRNLTTITLDNVTEIGNYAFNSCVALTEMILPDTVLSVGSYAFVNCSALTNLQLGASLRSVGERAFSGVKIAFDLPDTLETIGSYAFNGCTALTDLTLPSLLTLNTYAFNGCTSLASIALPAVQTVGNSAFSGCTALKTVTFGNGEATLGADAFAGCTALESISLNGVTTIGTSAFSGCYALKTVIMKEVTRIGTNAFNGCSAVETVDFGSALKGIGAGAFKGLNKLTNLVLPATVEIIGEGAFSGCGALTELTLPFVGNKAFDKTSGTEHKNAYPFGYIFGTTAFDGATSTSQYYYDKDGYSNSTNYYIPNGIKKVTVLGGALMYYAFYHCSDIETVIYYGETVFGNAMYYCGGLKSFTAPNATEVGDYAFYNCSALETVSIPKATSIGSYVFDGCTKLTSAALYDAESIGIRAFAGCTALESVVLEKVKVINDEAFTDCTALCDIDFPDTLQNVGARSFKNCVSFTSVTLPAGITLIRADAFNGCTGVETLSMSSTAGTASGALRNLPNLKSMTLNAGGWVYSGTTYNVFGYIFGTTSYTGSTAVTNGSTYYLPSGLTTVEVVGEAVAGKFFKNCTSLTTLSIASGVNSIGVESFCNCANLATVSFPTPAPALDYDAFKGTAWFSDDDNWTDNGLYANNTLLSVKSDATEITIKDGTTEIGARAFYDSKVQIINLPASVTSIGASAFYSATCITRVNYAGTVQDWLSISFANDYSSFKCETPDAKLYINGVDAESITSVTIPAEITSVPSYAFRGWTALESVTFASEEVTIGNYAFYGDSALKTISIAGENKKMALGVQALRNCTSLTDLSDIEITALGSLAFEDCSALTAVRLGSSVTTIDGNPFYGCSALKSISVDEGNTVFASFSGILYEIRYNGTYAFKVVPEAFEGELYLPVMNEMDTRFAGNQKITSLIVAEGTTTLPVGAFRNCVNLKTVVLPSTLTGFGGGPLSDDNYSSVTPFVFEGCSAIESLTWSGYYTRYAYTINYSGTSATPTVAIGGGAVGFLFGTASFSGGVYTSQAYHYYPLNSGSESTEYAKYYISSKLTKLGFNGKVVGMGAAMNLSQITEVSLSSSVTMIESMAFKNCTGLTSILFDGTISEWQTITKQADWNANTGNYVVTCSDGKIAKNGTILES